MRRLERNRIFTIKLLTCISRYSILFSFLLVFSTWSQAEETSCLDCETIIAVVPNNFPPHYITDASGNAQGLAVDILDAIAKRSQFKVQYISKASWTEVDQALANGEANVIPNLGITAGRQQRFDFTRPMEVYPVSVFTRSETDYIQDLKSLNGRKVAVVEYNVAAKILAKKSEINILTVEKPQDALFELLSGNVDAFAYPYPGASRIIDKIGVEDRIKLVAEPLKEIKRGMAVKKGNTKLLNTLDLQLKDFLKTPEYRSIYLKWHGTPRAYWTISRLSIVFLSILLTGILGFLVWRYLSLRRVAQINQTLRETITARMAAEKQSKDKEVLISTIFESIEEGVLVVGLDSAITHFNSQFIKLWGIPQTLLANGNDAKILQYASDQLIDSQSFVLEVNNTYKSEADEQDLITFKDGKVFERYTCALVIDGQHQGRIWSFRDITARRKAELELEHHKNHLEDIVEERTKELEITRDEALNATRAKSEFLANMSHELRTPLNSIIGFTGIVKDGVAGEVNQEQTRQLNMVYDSAKHLLALINDILDLSKVEAGKIELVPEYFSVNELVSELKGLFEQQAKTKGLQFKIDVADDVGQMFNDKGKLRQVLVNLIANAHKFTEQGSITLGIQRSSKSKLQFKVVDTGIGITSEYIDRIFESFQQVESGDVRTHEGTGLGLAITKCFVELLGGVISVESQIGKGSCFFVDLPEDISALTAVVGKVKPKESRSNKLSAKDKYDKKLILIIDDHHESRELLRTYLINEGYDVVTADNGRLGVELALSEKPFAITLDVLMPELDGWATLKELKNDCATASIPVIVVSIMEDMGLGLSFGAVDYLQKPIQSEILINILNKLKPSGQDILVIDDTTQDAQIVDAMLSPEGYQVRHAINGKNGLNALDDKIPDAIVLDLMMPEMSGFEFIREVRSKTRWRDLPIIVVSAKTLTNAEKRYLNSNVEAALTKGQFDRSDMVSEVGRVLSRLNDNLVRQAVVQKIGQLEVNT